MLLLVLVAGFVLDEADAALEDAIVVGQALDETTTTSATINSPLSRLIKRGINPMRAGCDAMEMDEVISVIPDRRSLRSWCRPWRAVAHLWT